MKAVALVTTLSLAVAATARDNTPPHTQPVRIKEIRIHGNDLTAARVIKRYCEFREGDVLEETELAARITATSRNLRNTHYFARVNVFRLPSADAAEAVIMIDVAEGTTWRASASTRQVRVLKDNIRGAAAALGAEGGFDRERLFFSQIWVGDLPAEARAEFFYENGKKVEIENDLGRGGESFYYEGAGAEFGGGYVFTLRGAAGATVLREYDEFYRGVFKAVPFRRFGVRPHVSFTAVKPYCRWDGRDDDLYPTRGFYAEGRAEFAPPASGDYDYYLGEGDFRGYVMGPAGIVVAQRLRVGAATAETPYVRRFSLANLDGLRSVSYYETAGTRMVLYSCEARRRVGRAPLVDGWFELVWFFDAGRTWDPEEPVRAVAFGYAFGPGVRLHVKSPLYLDWRGEVNLYRGWAVFGSARRGF